MLSNGKIILRQKILEDADNDYKWQSDPELAGLDAIKPLTISFKEYLAEYTNILSLPSPKRFQLAVETRDGVHIGNCACYNINYKSGEAEVGIMIGRRDLWDQGYGSDAVTALVDYIFEETNLKLLYLKTLDHNFRAQQCFRKCGFTPDGRGESDRHSFVLMNLKRRHWFQRKAAARTGCRR